MSDPTDDTDDRQQKPLSLNPEAMDKVSREARDDFELVECWVKEHPWHRRMIEGILHHLAGQLAGMAIGTALVVGGFVHPKSPEPVLPSPVCIASVGAQRPGERTTYRLVPCPPPEDTAQPALSGDGSG